MMSRRGGPCTDRETMFQAPISNAPLLRMKTLFRPELEPSCRRFSQLSISSNAVHMAQLRTSSRSPKRSNHAAANMEDGAERQPLLWCWLEVLVVMVVVVGDTGGCRCWRQWGSARRLHACASHPCRYRYIDARGAASSHIRPEADEPSSPDSFPTDEHWATAGSHDLRYRCWELHSRS